MEPMSDEARAAFELNRIEGPKRTVAGWKATMRARVDRTKALVGFGGFRGDMHMHSNHSDGAGTVDDIAFFKQAAGLDYVFVTDHRTVSQKADCLRHENVWLGEESNTRHHHLGILGLEGSFERRDDIVEDYYGAIELGAAAYIPHPTGWFPTTRYSEERIAELDKLGGPFAMEIVNGAGQIFDCWDETDAMAVELWDRHLRRGRFVTGLGNSDAHVPHAVGDVWNGVFADELSKEAVVDAVRAGRLFVSDAPIVNLSVKGAGGAVARIGESLATTGPVTISVLAAESIGLREVRLLRDGATLRRWRPDPDRSDEEQVVRQSVSDGPGATYYRLECFAKDGRRAYSNPVYIRPG